MKEAENRTKSLAYKARRFLTNNAVSILFVVIGVLGLRVSGLSLPFFFEDIVNRLARNSFMVLSLIIPVMAGLGLNFAIVLGAMAGQAAIIVVTHWKLGGIGGILLSTMLAFPLAVLLGIMTGRLLNRARGKEMITTLILGFFSNGIYQLVFLLLVGSVIPMKNDVLVLSSGVGLRTSIDLTGGLKNGLDDLLRVPFPLCAVLVGVILLLANGIRLFIRKESPSKGTLFLGGVLGLALLGWGAFHVYTRSMFNFVRVPVSTFLIVLGLCYFITFFTRTKLGQDMRTVGQDRHIAEVAGIDSDRIRIIAMVMSTVLASMGQIIFLQNLGTFSTYGSHEQAGMFAIAALLIGGASVAKATIGQALLGTLLFHTMFIVSPLAGRTLFGDAQLGEFFRAFVAYGIIGLSLALHSWKKQMQAREEARKSE
jgi:simple sugar transport system permease protein